MIGRWSCRRARAAFPEAWDGELSRRDLDRFEAHLGSCEDCRRERSRHDGLLDGLGPALHRLTENESPRSPFPERSPREPRFAALWLKPAALALSALAVGFVAIDHQQRGMVLPPATTLKSGVSPTHDRPCPWHAAHPDQIQRSVSYPVVTDPCLGTGFELVEAEVKSGRACDETVRLTYRSGGRSVVLEQHPEHGTPDCPAERVVVDRVAGCLERDGADATALVWSHGQQAFRLEGDMAPAEAVAMARSITDSLGQP